MNLNEVWVVEYSPDQKCFNIATATEVLRNNLRQTLEGWSNGYIPVAICESYEEAGAMCDMIADAMAKRGATTDAVGRIWMPEGVLA